MNQEKTKMEDKAKMLHNKLLANLRNYISTLVDVEDFEQFLQRFKGRLNPREMKDCKNFTDICNRLEKKGILKVGEYDSLIEVLSDFDMETVDMVTQTRKEIEELKATPGIGQSGAKRGHEADDSTLSHKRTKEEQVSSDFADLQENLFSIETYGRNQGQKGFAIIINMFHNREGTEFDFTDIKTFFQQVLCWDVTYIHDIDIAGLNEFLGTQQKHLKDNKQKYYCIAVFVLCHGSYLGGKDLLHLANDEKYEMDNLISCFRNDKMPEFKHRPKLFFIQKCRGSNHQPIVSDDEEVHELKINVPLDANVLIAFATTPGYKSYRHMEAGAYFIRVFMKVLKTSWSQDKHLEEMLLQVRDNVAHNYELKQMYNLCQMPCTYTTLTKHFLFFQTT